jgi:solute carrier family 10 (sodium/bile acid cotransporter), member 7
MTILRKHWFNLALPIVFVAAFALRNTSVAAGPLDPTLIHSAAVVLIFFLTGLMLPLREFRAGMTNTRLHVFALSFSFLLVPATVWGLVAVAGDALTPEMARGFLILAIMPTTITSCVVYTTMARGNVSGTVFSSIAGNFSGVLISPLLFAVLVAPSAETPIQWAQMGKLFALILLPLSVGLYHRALRGPLPPLWAKRLPLLTAGGLLTIIFFAFHGALSPASPLWNWTARELLVPVVLLFGLHVLLLGMAWLLAKAAGLPLADRKAAVFIGPQKTIALGLPMIHFFFAGQPHLAGALAIPLILYHPMQLLIAGLLASRLATMGEGGIHASSSEN